MFGGSLGLLDDRVGRKVPAALKRLLGKTTLDESNDNITLLMSSQYAGKVLFKHQGTKRAGITTVLIPLPMPHRLRPAPFEVFAYTAASRIKF